MAMKISVISNCDDAVIFWVVDAPIKGCLGFSIDRERKLEDGSVERVTLENRVGFQKDDPKPGQHRLSTVWPFQRFWWADHSVNSGDRVRYRVTPMVPVSGQLAEQVSERSPWTAWTELSGDAGAGVAAYFNRGLVISQFMARYLEDLRKKEGLANRDEALKAFKKSLDDHELPIRKFLAGALRDRMLELLKEARTRKQHVYGALYELDDDELVTALAALRSRAHVVLSNGSITPKKGEGTEAARKRDQNKAGRKRLRDAGVEVLDRFISPGALGHNKFLVLTGTNGKSAQATWTGSTNWTKTGLCTQINNGLFVKHAAFADEYLEQWKRLRDAKSEFPKALVDANSTPKKVTLKSGKADIWFTRARGRVDLDAIDEVIDGAKEGVLFLMFQPGGAGTLKTVRSLLAKPGRLYVKGVVSTLPDPDSEDEVSVTVHDGSEKSSVDLDIVQPEGNKKPLASWAAAVTRSEFLYGPGKIGFAIVHSKLIVVDPFTKPVVITGSHNFSTTASGKNDENFVVMRGNSDLAQEYGAHVLSVYHHYRWMAYLNDESKKKRAGIGYLRDDDTWQAWQLKGQSRKELDFWLR